MNATLPQSSWIIIMTAKWLQLVLVHYMWHAWSGECSVCKYVSISQTINSPGHLVKIHLLYFGHCTHGAQEEASFTYWPLSKLSLLVFIHSILKYIYCLMLNDLWNTLSVHMWNNCMSAWLKTIFQPFMRVQSYFLTHIPGLQITNKHLYIHIFNYKNIFLYLQDGNTYVQASTSFFFAGSSSFFACLQKLFLHIQ